MGCLNRRRFPDIRSFAQEHGLRTSGCVGNGRFLICSLWVSSVSSCNVLVPISTHLDPYQPAENSHSVHHVHHLHHVHHVHHVHLSIYIYIYMCIICELCVGNSCYWRLEDTHTHIGHGTDTSSEHDLNFMLCNWVCPQAVGTPNFHDLFFHLHMAVWTIFFSDRPKFQCW